jgi:hypothetical protein
MSFIVLTIPASVARKLKKKSKPIYPVTRPTVQVCHSDHDQRFAVNAVDQTIGETRQPTATNSWVDLRI